RATVVPPRDQVTRVAAHCFPDRDAVELTVNDPLTGKSLQRSVDLSAAGPAGRPRLLALSIIELVWTSWTELEADSPAAPGAAADIRAEALTAVRERRGRPMGRIGVASLVHPRFGDVGPTYGAGLRYVAELAPALAVPIELGYERGDRDYSVGT